MDNPHNINIHTQNINESEVEDPLKYLCLSYEKYGLSVMPTVTEYACINGKYSELTDEIKKNISDHKISKLGVGSQVASITIDTKEIGAFVGNDGEIVYLSKSSGLILKPNDEVYDEFFDSLDNFQKILLNRDTKYTATFEVISENSFGYVTELKSFTFPTAFGNNNEKYKNLAVNNAAYNSYLNDLMKYAKFYDEYFSDNLWRSMTHEAIKNFDWTYTREYGVGEEEGYVFGGTRMQKTIRLIAREFDEIKTYIDGLKNFQKVDYGKGNAIPDYLLTDALIGEGWNIENIYPYNSDFKQVQKLNGVTIKPYSSTYVCDNQKNGYFYLCSNGCSGAPTLIQPNGNYSGKNEIYDPCINSIRPLIKQYISDNEVSLNDINNHFMRMLKLNSKAIFRKKGTIQAIESLLGLFGLKSKRWYDEYYGNVTKQCIKCGEKLKEDEKECPNCKGDKFVSISPDYEIREYVALVNNGLEDPWSGDSRNMNKIDWLNYTKTVSYDTEEYRNGIYNSYQGLPVRAYIGLDENEKIIKNTGVKPTKLYQIDRLPVDEKGNPIDIDGGVRYLYPYFSPYKLIDGNPYYQMNGGWLNRNYAFDVKNQIITKDNNTNLYKETYRNIKTVKTLKEMINIPKTALKNGDLCFVEYLGGEYVIMDGVLYELKIDKGNNNKRYISTYIVNNTTRVGSKYFASELTVSNKDNTLTRYVFNEYKNETEIRIYVNDDNRMVVYGKYYAVNNIIFCIDGNISSTHSNSNPNSANDKKYLHYFKLNNLNNKSEIGGFGWNQLDETSQEYSLLDSIVDNFKGNNPHTGHLNYDNGKEYLKYFTQLFKYALEENQFNERCYCDNFFEEIENIRTIGFSGLGENDINCEYPEYLDSKIHYFGNILDEDGNETDLTIEKSYSGDGYTNISDELDGNNISDQIVNIKRVDIIFNNQKTKQEIKYFDKIIMNYLEQILSSTLIINIDYGQLKDTQG